MAVDGGVQLHRAHQLADFLRHIGHDDIALAGFLLFEQHGGEGHLGGRVGAKELRFFGLAYGHQGEQLFDTQGGTVVGWEAEGFEGGAGAGQGLVGWC
ncbi:MAG: hypothetical protein H7293_04660 [Candidatus Saccharibacteria bacterium]|nr:hypothetical protein [Rhodoferax sp.]